MNICSAPFAPSFWTPHLIANTPNAATDTFDRANNATSLGTADSGQTWVHAASAWAISSNLAKTNGSATALARLECYGADGTLSVELPVNGNGVGLTARFLGTTVYLRASFNGGNLELVEKGAAVTTVLDSVALSPNNGDVLKMVLAGSSITVYVNNVLKLSGTSTQQLNSTQHGIFSDLNSTARFNNFNFVFPTPENVTDNFNRADNASSLGTASDGIHTWFAKTTSHGIISNQAYNPSGLANRFTCVASNAPNCTLQVTLPVNLNGTSIGFRATDNQNFLFAGWSGGNLVLVKKVANANTTIVSASPTLAPANGQVLKVVLFNSSIEVYVDNVLKISATETFNQLANQHGLYSSFGSGIYRYDDFSITV